MIDLVKALSLPLLIVAKDGLGTLNHTLLTLEAARARSIPVLGLVVNGVDSTDPDLIESNCAELARLSGHPVLACFPHDETGTSLKEPAAKTLSYLLANAKACEQRVEY